MFSSILMFTIDWITILLLGYYKTVSDVGIYNAALPTSALLYITPMALFALFVPILTELSTLNKDKEFKTNYKTVAKWIFFINLPIFLFLSLFSKQVLSILFGNNYITGSTPLIILSFGYLIYFMFDTSSKILNIIRKTKFILLNTIVALSASIILNIILIPKYGINGAAIANASSLIVYNTLSSIEAFYFTKIQPIGSTYAKSLIAGLITLVLTLLLMNFFIINNLISLIASALIFMLVYLSFIILLKALSKEDLYIIKSIRNKLKI